MPSWVPSSWVPSSDAVGTVGEGRVADAVDDVVVGIVAVLLDGDGLPSAEVVQMSAGASRNHGTPRSIPRIIASAAFCMHALTSACSVLLSGVALTTRSKSSSAARRARPVCACAVCGTP